MEGVAYGILTLTPSAFRAMTARQFVNAIRGREELLKAEAKRREHEERASWERARFVAFHSVNVMLTKETKMRDMRQLVRFSWEEKLPKPQKKDWDKCRKLFPSKLPEKWAYLNKG